MAHNSRFSLLPLDCRMQLALQFSFRLRLYVGHMNIQCGPIHERDLLSPFLHAYQDTQGFIQRLFDVA